MNKVDDVFRRLFKEGKIDNLIDVIEPSEFDDFASALFLQLQSACKELERHVNDYYHMDEEPISSMLGMLLGKSGYKAHREPSERGHIDLFVTKNGYAWIVEAKIGYDNNKIFEGLLQLASRYLTNQRSACIVIYYKHERPLVKLNEWKKYILNKGWSSYALKHSIAERCQKYFEKTKECSGSEILNQNFAFDMDINGIQMTKIYNLGVDLHFNPIDKSGRGNKKLQSNNDSLYLKQSFFDYKTDPQSIDVSEVMSRIGKVYGIE